MSLQDDRRSAMWEALGRFEVVSREMLAAAASGPVPPDVRTRFEAENNRLSAAIDAYKAAPPPKPRPAPVPHSEEDTRTTIARWLSVICGREHRLGVTGPGETRRCQECNGSGFATRGTCPECDGEGQVVHPEAVWVSIPQHVYDEMRDAYERLTHDAPRRV